MKSPTRGNGAAIWLESVKKTGFRICVLEFEDGSNGTAEVNWIAVQPVLSGTQIGTTSLGSWTTGTECKRIDFPQVSVDLETVHFAMHTAISIKVKLTGQVLRSAHLRENLTSLLWCLHNGTGCRDFLQFFYLLVTQAGQLFILISRYFHENR